MSREKYFHFVTLPKLHFGFFDLLCFSFPGGVHSGEAAPETVNPVHNLYICPFSGYNCFPALVYNWHCCRTYSLLMKMSVINSSVRTFIYVWAHVLTVNFFIFPCIFIINVKKKKKKQIFSLNKSLILVRKGISVCLLHVHLIDAI